MKLIFSKLSKLQYYLVVITSVVFIWFKSPLSSEEINRPELSHCGQVTYTGFFYPLKNFLNDAHRDDLEARNQMCWLKKMILATPSMINLQTYTQETHKKLLLPEIKYRISLPLIAALYLKINLSAMDKNALLNVYDSLYFWIDNYTEEINQRNYSIWNWPHSTYIQFEYGLIEHNWKKIIDSIILENN